MTTRFDAVGQPNLDVFGQTLLEMGRADRDVIVVTSDSRGSGRLGPFAEALPDQIVEVGIAEQDLVGIAAGLASAGKIVYAVSPACFLTARALEQIKNDVAYSDNRVIVVGISAGAICWHEWGHSDSRSFSGRPDWPYVRVKGLGFLPGLFCPHLDGEARSDSLAEMVQKHGDRTVACDNNAAVYYDGPAAVCVSSRKRARSHVYERRAGEVAVRSYRDGEALDI